MTRERRYKEHCAGCVQDVAIMGWPLYCPECEKLNRSPRPSRLARFLRRVFA